MVRARGWILSSARDELFDFDRLCEELDIDPGVAKRREQSTWGEMPEECERGKRGHTVRSVPRKLESE